MNIINEPIKVMAVFHVDGKIEPIKFKLEEQVIWIEKVIRTYEEQIAGNNRTIFVCQHNGKDIYELKYELRTKTWFLFKQ